MEDRHWPELMEWCTRASSIVIIFRAINYDVLPIVFNFNCWLKEYVGGLVPSLPLLRD
tara:strand:+ start:187 stop:360 length:174 start_codon:yes stop_codon:yes gene_type:complete